MESHSIEPVYETDSELTFSGLALIHIFVSGPNRTVSQTEGTEPVAASRSCRCGRTGAIPGHNAELVTCELFSTIHARNVKSTRTYGQLLMSISKTDAHCILCFFYRTI